MERPRYKKTAVDWLMQVISLVVVLVVLGAVWAEIRSSEQSTLRPWTPGRAEANPTPTGGQQTRGTLASWQADQTQPARATAGADDSVASGASAVEPRAGAWPTWVLKSGSEIKVAPPPNAQATATELGVLRDLASKRDAATRSSIQYWDAGSPSYRWVQLALQQLETQRLSIPRANQALSMMNVAVYESMVTVWQAKHTYNRPRPADLDPSLAAIATPLSPSYPDEHAAAAGAAAAILSFLYPEQADQFAAMASAQAQSRLQAGVAFPSDVSAGMALGQTVAGRVIAYSGAATFGGGLGIIAWWNAPALQEPLTPPWRPWTLAYAGEFLPPAPAAWAAQATRDELLHLQQVQTAASSDARSAALFWNSFAGTYAYWYDLAAEKMAHYHMDTNPPLAARIYALMSVAHDDASDACWDALSTYRVLRPSLATSEALPLTAATPYSFPSVTACLAGSMSVVLAAVFTLDAPAIQASGEQAAQAGLWVDGALPDDVRAGRALGRVVALHVLSHPLSWLWAYE
jgi:membrane-associated phospholipid phosphatase